MDLLHIDIFYQYVADCFIKLNNAFVLPDPEPPIISILYKFCSILLPEKLMNFVLHHFHQNNF